MQTVTEDAVRDADALIQQIAMHEALRNERAELRYRARLNETHGALFIEKILRIDSLVVPFYSVRQGIEHARQSLRCTLDNWEDDELTAFYQEADLARGAEHQ